MLPTSRLFHVAAAAALLLTGCEVGLDSDAIGGDSTTLRLEANEDGSLQYCPEDADHCTVVDNPRDCSVLEVTVDTASGQSCERCLDADGTVSHESCEGTAVACTVVTAPEPDCVVCAHVDGPVLYSSCVAPEPDCAVADDGCEYCYDSSGAEVFTSCAPACDASCPDIDCPAGFRMERDADACCGVCVPADDCAMVECAAMIPDCPEGTDLVQHGCCEYRCEPYSCDAVMCPAVECADGFERDFSSGDCCGTCVPTDDRVACQANSDCPTGSTCDPSVCLSNPACSSDGFCTDECWGQCVPESTSCPDIGSDIDPSSCEGEWVYGYDAAGCPTTPRCACPDGTLSENGTCVNVCDLVDCVPAELACEPGFHYESDYPYCCGACVEDPAPRTCEATGACASGSSCVDGECVPDDGRCATDGDCSGVGEVCEGYSVCPDDATCIWEGEYGRCVASTDVVGGTACASSSECSDTQHCSVEDGVCDAPPDCDAAGENCATVCYGTCVAN